jgi:hypothetical protein
VVKHHHPEQLPSQLQGIGQLVLLFGSGLLFGVLFGGVSMVIKISVAQSKKRPSESWLHRIVGFAGGVCCGNRSDYEPVHRRHTAPNFGNGSGTRIPKFFANACTRICWLPFLAPKRRVI